MFQLVRINPVCKSRQRSQLWLFLLAGLGLVIWTGCGDGRPKRVPVSGHVTIDGQPLTFGSISFVPKNGERPGGGAFEEGGLFRVSTFTPYDGLPPGTYDVTIAAIEPIGETAQRWHAPMTYANVDTCELSIEITGETDGLQIELTWEGDKHSKPFVEKF